MTTIRTSKRIHPLVAAAAISVMLVSLVGVAAITGIIPNSYSSAAPAATASATADIGKSAVAAPVPAPAVAQAAEAPVHKTHKPVARPSSQTVAHAQQICRDCGIVESIDAVQQKAEHGSGLGAVTGALIGGVLGNQVGGGNGRKLATVAGAVGGGYAGNEVERNAKSTTVYHVRVRLEDGNVRTFTPSGQPDWRVGDRVRIIDGHLASRG